MNDLGRLQPLFFMYTIFTRLSKIYTNFQSITIRTKNFKKPHNYYVFHSFVICRKISEIW